ncbi:MutS family protein MSH5 [Aspergillus candidus]|uniref:DNA mismatch repair protein MSH5 n=1 Tax=Aspergillus candidus TaxID=41067 RepID=A0A2I2F1Z1_ASPCN|nr:putative DNA mismatch repair protein Msh5 [Aspergillus candidus]PLB34650.1 putative DNA mismatch repair protein Msh5 [Aspergillus candidus]
MSNSSLRGANIMNQLQRDIAFLYNSDDGAGELTDDDLDLVVVAIDDLHRLVDTDRASVILQTKPTVLLTSTRVDHFDAQKLQSFEREDSQGSYLPYRLDVRPSQEFSYLNARNKLVALEIYSKHEQRIKFLVPHNGLMNAEDLEIANLDFTLEEARHLHVLGAIDMDSSVTIGCAGAVLAYLQRRRATVSVAGDATPGVFQISSVEMFSLRGTMFVNERTLLSLQILESESHPSMINKGLGRKSSSKEGLSVYGLFQRFAHTPQGRNRLRQLFLRPSVDLDVVRERHAFVSVYLRPENCNPLNKIIKSLKHIKNLHNTMLNLRKGISTGSGKIAGFKTTVWATLLAFAFYGIDIHDALKEIASGHEVDLHNEALRTMETAQLFKVGRIIQEIVDIDSSEEQGRTVVKPGLDRELDKLKDSYDGLSDLLKKVAIEIAATVPESLGIDVNVIYFPQLGFNIAIPLNDRGTAAYSGTDEDWELIFITENRAYFKDFRMREMDDKLGDIFGLICEKEIEIVYDLAQRVLQHETTLLQASDLCGKLDSHLAFVQAAGFYKLVRPKMTEGNVIRIKGGRHILQELTVPSYVPNDTFIVGGGSARNVSDQTSQFGPSILLLTGPNYSGKSIYMKQVALIVYLAQLGSFVPAEKAEIGMTDKILVKTSTRDSVSQIQSTFMNDLQQISFDLKQVTSRSLFIIDEFGKGTNESDGIGLACGILRHLLDREEPPKVIAATHFHEILENGFLTPGPRLQLGHMEVQVCEEPHEGEDQMTYLYKLRAPHMRDIKNALLTVPNSCAAMNGISQSIVDRANELASSAARGENLVAACAVVSTEEMQALKEADVIARRFLSMGLSENAAPEVVETMLDEVFDGLGY